MEKRNRINDILSTVGKTTKSLIDTTIQAVDQNDDGKFDMEDVSTITESVGIVAKKGALVMMDNATDQMHNWELKLLQPIFEESLDAADFMLPKVIRIVERDKRHAESEVCKGSIGYSSNPKGLPIVNVFDDSVEKFRVSFYPDSSYEFYYADPCERDRYIALDEYFSYLKIARINELQKLAQDLGAKYFKVTYKEEKTSFSEKKMKGQVKVPKVVTAEVEHNSSEKQYSKVEIMAEMECPGHEPIMPQMHYLKRDPSIQNLITMRFDEKAPLMRQKFMIKLSSSSGLKEVDAIKIDAALKELKCSGNTTVTSEAQNESRRSFEYEIEF